MRIKDAIMALKQDYVHENGRRPKYIIIHPADEEALLISVYGTPMLNRPVNFLGMNIIRSVDMKRGEPILAS